MAVRIVSDAAAEPVSLTEAKLHCRITGDTEDAFITNLIKAARQWAEDYQGCSFVCKTYELTIDDGFPEIIYPPYPPLVSVNSIKYIDGNGDTQAVSDTIYTLDTITKKGRIYEAYNQSWPTCRTERNAIAVNYVAGYSAPFTANDTTNVITASGRTYENGDIVQVWNLDGALPTGLSAATYYYVISASTNTIKLSATLGGTEIDITAIGTGTHYIGIMPETVRHAIKLLVAHWYEHREEVLTENLYPIPMGATALLMQDRVW